MAEEKQMPTRIPVEHEDFLRAARGKDTAKVSALLEKDPALVDCVEAGGYAALHFASFNGDAKMIELLAAKGANLHLENMDGNAPLVMAAKGKQGASIRALVAAGADINRRTESGATAAHTAVSMGDLTTLRLLVELGAVTAVKDETASGGLLHWATHSGSTNVVGAVLYEFGIPVDAVDAHGGTPLFTALFMAKSDVVQFLLEHGANPSAVIPEDGTTPLHIAGEYGEVEDVKQLIGFGANVEAKNSDGQTPLQVAEAAKAPKKPNLRELQKPTKTAQARQDDAARFKAHGNKVFSEGENVKAAKFYTLAIQNDPSNHVFFSNRAACFYNMNQFQAAYYDACRCIVLAPTWSKGYFRKGSTEIGMKEYERAKKTVDEGLRLDKSNKDLVTLSHEIEKKLESQRSHDPSKAK